MLKSEDVYCFLNEDIKVLFTELGCEVFKENEPIFLGNSDLAAFLKACDGSLALKEIVKKT